MSHICIFCKTLKEGHGNNPFPIRENGKCCDECNQKYVIPERIKLMKKEDKRCQK